MFLLLSLFFFLGLIVNAQVSSVQFGKNRVQYKKFKWQYYQTKNFNSYFNQNGQELAKYVAQVAEEELPAMEKFVEFSLQRRANIIIYNSFGDLQQSNIGIGIDWQSTGGVTKLVNNKMIVYFNSNHADLRRQIREGIAKVLTENLLFGEDLGEVAGNAALLDLPQWLIDGYEAYAGQNWSTQLDDQLKSEILSGKYKNFYQFAFDKPLLAGHAFWYYIEEKYKRENTTYLLYLARVYKSLNRASQTVTKKRKFKEVLADFMTYEEDKYDNDISRRKNYPKGSEITEYTIGKRIDYFHFNVNPNKRNGSFAVVQYKKGKYRLLLNEDDKDKTLLKFGTNSKIDEINLNYPMMAWDPKGTRLSVLYEEEGHIKLFVYDVITRVKPYKRDLTDRFDQVQDMKYMDNGQSLLFSAVKNGHSDIYSYDIENDKLRQITNDVYDDLDPSFVSFPNKTGIIFSSNRPAANTKGSDTSLLNNRYNIFMVTDFASGRPGLNQITQLTNLKFGDARYPTQYSNVHFTFVSDQNGVGNRYAGLFSTEKEGLDTLVLIGDDILRNPTELEVDSLLKVYKKKDIDSVAIVSVSKDSAYVFPLTNYESSLLETREAGENHQVSEVTRQSDDKILYKLKIDENALQRRNVGSTPTAYMKHLMEMDKISKGEEVIKPGTDTSQSEDLFQNEFKDEKRDTSSQGKIFDGEVPGGEPTVLSEAKLYPYKPLKFATDYIVAGFNNDVLGTRYQLYQGGSGPVNLSSNSGLDGTLRMGIADIMEDIKISGGYRLSTNLKDNDWLLQFNNLRRRLDWGLSYYRTVQAINFGIDSTSGSYPGKIFSNLYQGSISYPFDVTKSIRLNVGVRKDRGVVSAFDNISLTAPEISKTYGLLHLEYVYDNTLNPAQNIWNGIRYKAYVDWNSQISKLASTEGRYTFNFGFDARGYYPIYRNFIWAGRVAGDFSWGNQKLIYYLGGIDNWFMFGNNVKSNGSYRYFNQANKPAPDGNYAFQSLAVNLRGFIQNAANGNNNLVINSEFRLPVFTTLFSKPINNAFVRNFQLTQFIDLGSAWNGAYNKLIRPNITYADPSDPTVTVNIKAPGVGPFLGGYGFGARSTLLGYFLKMDAGWPMNGFFKGKPIYYFSMGLDF
ncbi:hypothetical protein FW778_06875 [Ginsengibacter hankyongi]|uniref:WD40-like Beta Propeller Repeat n=1 Tax=Ginsengibacter hankyongi TaxID=2607284 RepID=A0A5J5IPS4_9BACT|nr:hypothetical protein FW778_06875 [Ginsengibacter hankyongi]